MRLICTVLYVYIITRKNIGTLSYKKIYISKILNYKMKNYNLMLHPIIKKILKQTYI